MVHIYFFHFPFRITIEIEVLFPGVAYVGSLTQLYFVDFSQLRTGLKKGLRQLFLTVSWEHCAQHAIGDGVLASQLFRKQRTRRVEGHVS